jgi:hypothetical protein
VVCQPTSLTVVPNVFLIVFMSSNDARPNVTARCDVMAPVHGTFGAVNGIAAGDASGRRRCRTMLATPRLVLNMVLASRAG